MMDYSNLSKMQIFAVWALPVLFAITVHEVAHGWVASQFGDKTAKVLGRLTLNPLKHIDLIGTIIVPSILLMLGGFIFGWAKPVPVNWQNLRHPRRDMALVALAGPSSNLLMALTWAAIAKLGMWLVVNHATSGVAISLMGQAGIQINLMLMLLNLLPIPPLDGSRVVSSLLPPSIAIKYDRFELMGFLFLLMLLAFGFLQMILVPPLVYSIKLISQLFNLGM